MPPRHFLDIDSFDAATLRRIVDMGHAMKRAGKRVPAELRPAGIESAVLMLIFEKPSTRTRVSMEVAVAQLGGTPLVLREAETQLSRGESLQDFALVMSRYVDAIGIRTAPHETLEGLAKYSTVPVINLLTARHHPCQVLADLLTLRERFGRLEGLRLAYTGDGNNMATSLMLLGAKAGVEVAVATPTELRPDDALTASLNGKVSVTTDPAEAAAGAHALYTDVWVSMGDDEAVAESRRSLLAPYQLDEALLAQAREDAIALHCLPAHPGEEITAEVLYGERSAVWDQAENRLHAQKALLEFLIGPER